MMEKIKALKVKLKVWNKEVFGMVETNKKTTLVKVSHWDNVESQRPLFAIDLKERLIALEEFKKWYLIEEISWRKKSSEIWLKEGDRNMGFFERMANSIRRRNNIDRVRIGGDWRHGEEHVRSSVVNAYKVMLSNPGGWRASP